MVVSASEGGKTKLQVIPRGFLVEVQEKVRRYQELRRVRARLGEIYRKMLKVMDEMEAMRREEFPSPDDGQGNLDGMDLVIFEENKPFVCAGASGGRV